MSQATSADQEVVFGNTVEALFIRALGDRLTPKIMDQLKAAGIDVKAKLKPYYPRTVYYDCLRIAAREIFSGMTEERALFELGKAFMRGFEQTLLGRATLAAIRVMGPKRTLAKMTTNFRSSNNYMQTEVTELAPGHMELTLSQTSGAPSYFQGVLTVGLEVAGGKDVDITRKTDDGTHCTLSIRWRA